MKRVLLLATGLLLTAGLAAGQGEIAVIEVDAMAQLLDIPPAVYGANYGTLNMITPDLYPLVPESGITWWRFPGGAVGDDQLLQRSTVDLYMGQARLFGLEMLIQARMEGGSPEMAADLVRMVNIDRGYDVRLWSIGNEADLYDDYTAEQASAEWRANALAMLEVDPDLVLVGPDTSQFTGNTADNPRAHEFLRVFLETNGDLVDIVSVHRYPFPDNRQGIAATIADLRADAPRWTDIAANLHEWVLRYTGRDLPVAMNEVASHWSAGTAGEATPDSHYNAIWWADVLGRIITGGVDRVAYFGMQTNDGLSGHGLLARYDARPTYYTYALYAEFGETLVRATVPDDDVRAYAALRQSDGALTIMLINMADEAHTRRIAVSGFETVSAAALRFDSTQEGLAELDVNDSLSDAGLELPPQSITLLTLTPAASP